MAATTCRKGHAAPYDIKEISEFMMLSRKRKKTVRKQKNKKYTNKTTTNTPKRNQKVRYCYKECERMEKCRRDGRKRDCGA